MMCANITVGGADPYPIMPMLPVTPVPSSSDDGKGISDGLVLGVVVVLAAVLMMIMR